MIYLTWFIALLALIGAGAISWQYRWGFLLWIITNAFWVVYDYSIGAYAQSGLFAAYFLLAVVGWFKWRKPKEEK